MPVNDMANMDACPVGIEVRPNQSAAYRVVKRAFDIVVSIGAMAVLSPVFLVTALAVAAEDGFPVIFTQERSGLDGKPFQMKKFRSMCKNAPQLQKQMEGQNQLDGPAFKMRNDPRITRTGRLIRRLSVDELPQFWNILRGEMSIVGPRPLPTYETARLTQEQRKRLMVKPGILCYWQIRGRSQTTFEQWMRMDFTYINEASFWTDLKICFAAVPAVLKGTGAE